MIAIVAVWILLLVPLILIGRKRRAEKVAAQTVRPLTLADRLRPLIERASGGSLSVDEKGHLERMLLSHWQDRLGLTDLDPSAAIAALRGNEQAGELLRSLENWLHRPPGSSPVEVDVAALLEPYRQVTTVKEECV